MVFGELDGGGSDTAAAAVDEDCFGGLGLAADEDGAVGGAVGDADGGALFEGEARGEWVDLGGGAEDALGVGAGEGAEGVDAIADFEVGGAGADGFDDAGGVGAGGEGELFWAVFAGADVGVDGVDADRLGTDDDLVGGGGGIGEFFEF